MDIALGLLVVTALALVWGGGVLWRREGARTKAVLMFVLALVMALNVVIWTLPTRQGTTLLEAAAPTQKAPQ